MRSHLLRDLQPAPVLEVHRNADRPVPPFPRPCLSRSNFERNTVTLGKRWLGCMLLGVGLMLFGISRQHWQEWSGFAILAAGIDLILPSRITGNPTF